MKSGNSFSIDNISDYTINNKGDEINGLELHQKKYFWSTKLLVKTIALSQIEAVTVK
jgi:uncharacterized protein YrrD